MFGFSSSCFLSWYKRCLPAKRLNESLSQCTSVHYQTSFLSTSLIHEPSLTVGLVPRWHLARIFDGQSAGPFQILASEENPMSDEIHPQNQIMRKNVAAIMDMQRKEAARRTFQD